MKTIEIFDPAMCCSTGLCGPSINPNLMRVAATIEYLKCQGVDITRHNLKDDPQVYVENEVVNNYLQEEGVEGLPLTLVDGCIAATKTYPTKSQFTEWTGIQLDIIPTHK